MRNETKISLSGAILIVASIGCHKPADASDAKTAVATVAAAPTTAPAMVDYQDKGTRFQYPNNWTPTKDADYELHLVPADGTGGRNITYDIPDLPPHFEWMISLARIENGYVDDLKKKHKDLHVDSSADQAIGSGAKARLVQSSWKANGTEYHDVALLIMRKGQVYLLTCDAAAGDLAATRADFDKISASLKWDK